MTKMISPIIFLSAATIKGWELYQMDVNNTFLDEDLDEEVCMTMPPRFQASNPNKVWQLRNMV